MSTKLYVGGLSYDTSDDGLREFFSSVGSVRSAEVIKDRDSGFSKGFGFVEMESDADAQKAINTLNGASLDGRQIKVDMAKPPRERRSGFGDRGDRGGYGGRGGGGGGGGGRRRRDY